MRLLKDGIRRVFLPTVVVLLAVSAILALGVGAVRIQPREVVAVLLTRLLSWLNSSEVGESIGDTIVVGLRLPRVVLSALTGASLAISGAVYQGIFRNPMADPYVMGASAGASLGAACAFMLPVRLRLVSLGSAPVLAFFGSLAAVALVYNLARVGDKTPTLSLILSGVIVSAILSSAVSFLMFLSSGQDLHGLVFWLMGGFSGKLWDSVVAALPYFLLGTGIVFYYSRELNAMLIGDEEAQHLGVDVQRVTRDLVFAASLLTASAVASGGTIGFVGLIVPHMVRMLLGPDHRNLMPASLVIGAIAMILADTAARTLMPPREIPVGIITSLVGGPFFLYLLRRYKSKIW